ncbi:hypothetical protein AALP_AA7G092600 [Arabis alpina]|uniref:Uncharacterized protein n=1 Tax=Arabis alpina TaxID=50452 RepID=A0A087GGX6_ARAAL|nr:hypothetical protein AALP_AA7G092600 [Arabis alpina]
MVVTSRGGRGSRVGHGGSQGQGHGGRATTGGGVNQISDRDKQTVGSGGRVKPTVGLTGGVSGLGGPNCVVKYIGGVSIQTNVAPRGMKQTGSDASTSHAPPPLNSREGTARADGLDTLVALVVDATASREPQIHNAGEVPAIQSGGTPPQRGQPVVVVLLISPTQQKGLQCTEFDQKGNPFGIGSLSQKFNEGKKKEPYATSSSAAVYLEELHEEMKSACLKIVEHDEEIRRRDEENKKRDEENRRRDAKLLELRQSHARVSEMEKLLSFLKKDDSRIVAYLDSANETNT